jgi:antitoxin component YwqK of YwqJK toxin-antitoxin module
MHPKLFFIIIVTICIVACKSKTNQIVNHEREGKWVTIDTLDYVYTTKGSYKNGNQVGTWKHFYNGKITRKDKFKKNKCLTRFYHPNGTIIKKGYSKTDSNDTLIHWYYSGKWRYYDPQGKPTQTLIFDKGKLIDSIIQKK